MSNMWAQWNYASYVRVLHEFLSRLMIFLGQKDKSYKRILRIKNMFLMFLCLNKLTLCLTCGRNGITPLRACFARVFTSPDDFFDIKTYKRAWGCYCNWR